MSNVLAIGDPHCPFTLKQYLRFCKNVDRKENCDKVVIIGDIIDNHYSSYHETDPDGMSAGDELDVAIKEVQKWYKAFPDAVVTIGNHDRIVARKAHTAGISSRWIRDYAEVLGTPGWEFVEDVVIDGVRYCHGDGKKAFQRAKADMQSTVQGHYHTESYVQWATGSAFKVFGMQVGCGIDKDSYAMAYGKFGPHPSIGCGVVKNGKVAINHMMEL
jgi:metallophosphoesterase superfamily enzyme